MTAYHAVGAALPLSIRAVEVTDPVVTLIGDAWSLLLMCPWHLQGPWGTISWESEDLEDEVWNLIGHEIVAISAGLDLVDPTFHLSGGMALSIQADSDAEPWVLALPELIVTGRKRHSEADS